MSIIMVWIYFFDDVKVLVIINTNNPSLIGEGLFFVWD